MKNELKIIRDIRKSGEIDETVVDNLKTILSCLPFEIDVYPTGRNSIQLEYFKNTDKDGIEIEVFKNCAVCEVIRNYEYFLTNNIISIGGAISTLLNFYYDTL